MRFRRTAATAAAAGLASVPVIATTDDAVAGSSHSRFERAIVREINAVRAAHGLSGLRASRSLARCASRHSRSQLRRDVVTHAGLSNRARRCTRARHVGETLAWIPGRGQAARTVRLWIQSPGHREQLLSGDYRRVGIGDRWGRIGGDRGHMITAILAGRG